MGLEHSVQRWAAWSDFLSGKHDRAHNRDQDQDGRYFKGQQVRGEKLSSHVERSALEGPEYNAFGSRQCALNDEADQPEKGREKERAEILDKARNLKRC